MTAIGELVVKIVPDAKDFRNETKRQLKTVGEEAGKAYNDGFASAVDKDGGRVRGSTAKSLAAGAAGAKVAGAAAGTKFVDGVDDAVARGSGRVTKRTTSLFDGFLGGLAFNAPMFRGVASTFGLMGGQALYAGAAVSALGAAVQTVAVGAVGLGVGVAAFTALSVASLKTAGTYQMQAAAMNVLMDSTEKGGQMMKDLVNFSKTTPFELEGTIDAAKRLMAMGFAAEEVLPTLTRIGNATAALGTGTEGLSRLALVMGQIRSKGKLMTQDVNQLAEQGIPLWDILATKLGKTRGEIMTLTENGLVPAETALEALNEYMDMKFEGTLQAQAETLLGTFENLKESFKLGFAQRLQDDLPKIAAAIRDTFPAFEGLSTRIADALGPALVRHLEGVKPAVEQFASSLGLLFGDLTVTWTPTMTNLANKLSAAFEAARPGLQLLSDAIASLVDVAAEALPKVGQYFSDLAIFISDVTFAAGGLVDNPIWDLLTAGPKSDSGFSGNIRDIGVAMLELDQIFQSSFTGITLGLASILENIPGMGGVVDALRKSAEETSARWVELEGRIARSKLEPKVRVQFEDMENQLAMFSAGLDNIPKEVLITAGIDTSRIATGSVEELRQLLALPDQVLIDAGLNPADIAAMQAEAARLLAWIEGQPAELQAIINADSSDLDAKIASAKTESQKDFWIKFKADPSGVLTAAAQANLAVTDLQGQVLILDSTTGTATLAADATPAQLELALAQNLVFGYDGTTATSTLLTNDQATATLEALGIKVSEFDSTTSTAELAADAAWATQEMDAATQRLMGWDALTGTSTLDADPSSANTHMDNASIALRLFGQSKGTAMLDTDPSLANLGLNETTARLNAYNASKGTSTLDANSRSADIALGRTTSAVQQYGQQTGTATLDANGYPASNAVGAATGQVNAFGRSTGTATLNVNNSGVFSGVSSALTAISNFAGKTFTAVLSTVTGRHSGGPIGLASGGQVPVAVSNGEYVLGPRTVNRIGMGNALALNAGIPIKPGLVRGAGTSTSDSIRGTLPPGSFVIKESSVRKLGSGYLRSLATGGSVSGQGGTVKAGNTYNWTVTAKSEPTEETMLTLLRRADAIYGV